MQILDMEGKVIQWIKARWPESGNAQPPKDDGPVAIIIIWVSLLLITTAVVKLCNC
jgi:hypothetical protein